MTVTLAIEVARLERFAEAEAFRLELGERAYAAAQRKVKPFEKPDWVDDASA